MLHAPPSDREPQRPSSGSAALPSPGANAHPSEGPTPARDALAGRRIGLICKAPQAPAAALFIEAAESLGAQVAVLHATDVVDAWGAQQDRLVRMLSRLYDVIECQDLPPGAVRRIAEQVAVPVLANLGACALEEGGAPAPEPGTPGWEQGLTRVRQALLSAL
ncbi:hypothetical protein OU995_19615 [Roseateles sp. SL47]|jgi:hypothetical protein|uniref:hypothetical protein n=1 Tax=Roseateles sp. SL47 TaxID=2995138 RepID=UPI00226E24A8|nr:hypothetical protein [Roseateles sp. SL47]WAC71776.1 hypothetical protein OU995_19615 [Roseateles sp. SL47]